MKKPPIVITCFNRPDELSEALIALEKNQGIENRTIYFFIDGPRNQKDKIKINMVNKVIKEFSKNKIVHIQNNKKNNGLRKNMTDNLNFIFSKHESAIIMEDDTVVSSDFLLFMDYHLKKFNKNNRIAAINSWIPRNLLFDGYFQSRMFRCWGFGTWERVWKDYRRKPEIYKKYSKFYLRYHFDNIFTEDFTGQLRDNFFKKKDTWAVYFEWLVFEKNLKCISPTRTLSKNIGFANPTNANIKIYQPILKGKFKKFSLIKFSFIIENYLFISSFINKVISKLRSLI